MSTSKTLLSVFALLLTIMACKDKVLEFSGFTQKEMEYLLASDEIKTWQRISREEKGEAIVLEGCNIDNYLIFLQGSLGNPKPLLYAYNPAICDSLEFCQKHPEFCVADTIMCAQNADFCESLGDGILYIGSWFAKEPFIENSRSDTLIFEINGAHESIQVLDITANFATLLYKGRQGNSGGSVVEYYQNSPLIDQ